MIEAAAAGARRALRLSWRLAAAWYAARAAVRVGFCIGGWLAP